MSIYALKPKFQNLLRPLVRQLAAKGVTANQVTLIACLLSIFIRCGSRTLPDIFLSFLSYSYLVVFTYGFECH